MHDFIAVKFFASSSSPSAKKDFCNGINYFLWMKSFCSPGICEERNRELNKHLCATEGTFRCLRFQFFESNVYRTGCIADLLAMKYRRLIADIEINWKISFALKTILLCMEFVWVLPCMHGRQWSRNEISADISISAKCWNTNIFYS